MRAKFIILLSVLVFSFTFAASAKDKKESKEEPKKEVVSDEMKQQISQEVSSKRYIIALEQMTSQGGDVVNLTFGYSVEIEGPRLICRMPGFGLDGPHKNYKVETNRKGNTVVTFGANSLDFYYTFNIEIVPDGRTTVKILSNYDLQNRRTELWLYGYVYLYDKQ